LKSDEYNIEYMKKMYPYSIRVSSKKGNVFYNAILNRSEIDKSNWNRFVLKDDEDYEYYVFRYEQDLLYFKLCLGNIGDDNAKGN
jgi:hypothetical protein